jgi:hypothetical protein
MLLIHSSSFLFAIAYFWQQEHLNVFAKEVMHLLDKNTAGHLNLELM